MKDIIKFKECIKKHGWVKIDSVYSPNIISNAINELENIRNIYDSIQRNAGVYEDSKNAYHHSIVMCSDTQLRFLDPFPFYEHLKSYFGGNFILSSMGTTFVEPNVNVYTQNIHRDSRSFSPNDRLLLNMLIMLDDSTIENGATWLLEGSHHKAAKPSTEEFFNNATRITGKSGDVIFFDGNAWHCGGQNFSDNVRRIITPLFSKPYFKQSLDYPRAFGMDYLHKISSELSQILGYKALTPKSLTEFYKPKNLRFYKSDQG